MIEVAPRLAAFAVDFQPEAIPTEVRSRANVHLLDAIGCGLAAAALGAGAEATTVAATQGGACDSSLLGETDLVPAPLAALANGTRFHALDFDDTHERGICHCSAVVGPAALAVGEAEAVQPAAVLDAFILGSEVALRIAIALADGLYERGFHPTPICGSFGAAAAAARLYSLTAAETCNALGIVGSFASGILEYLADGSATKPLHAGWAAQAGVQAALLAKAGGSGPSTVIEGRFGVLRSHTNRDDRAAEITSDLGQRWEVSLSSIKAFPACHFAHASTWAAGELADARGISPDEVSKIVVRIPREGEALVLEPTSSKLAPRTPYDAKFSLPFMVAHRLVHGEVGLAAFSEKRIGDPQVLALARRIGSEPLEGEPPSRFAGGVHVTTRSGQEFDLMVDHVPGSPLNRLSDAQVAEKFRSNAGLVLERYAVEIAVERFGSFDATGDPLRELLAPMRNARPLAQVAT